MNVTTRLGFAIALLGIGAATAVLVRAAPPERRGDRFALATDAQFATDAQADGDPGAGARRRLERYYAHLREHEAEQKDESWAGPMEAHLASQMQNVDTSGSSHLVSVDCRTTTCVAKIEFSSYATRRDIQVAYGMHQYGVNCAVEIDGPVPDDQTAQYVTSEIFDCPLTHRGVQIAAGKHGNSRPEGH